MRIVTSFIIVLFASCCNKGYIGKDKSSNHANLYSEIDNLLISKFKRNKKILYGMYDPQLLDSIEIRVVICDRYISSYKCTIFKNSKSFRQKLNLKFELIKRHIDTTNNQVCFSFNRLKNIPDTNNGCFNLVGNKSCGLGSFSYQVIGLLTKSRSIHKFYNYPEFYENNCCPGDIDRRLFIKVWKFLQTNS